jgi:rod shape-determining protein MreD
MGRRAAIAALLLCALVGDAVLGALQPATARPPLVSLAVVAGVALFAGARLGMVSGLVAGVVLDLLSGPASVAGIQTLTTVLTGAVVGYGRRHPRHEAPAVAAAVGSLAVAGATVLSIVLQRMLGSAVAHAFGPAIAQAVVVGALVTTLAHRILLLRVVRPLLPKRPAA